MKKYFKLKFGLVLFLLVCFVFPLTACHDTPTDTDQKAAVMPASESHSTERISGHSETVLSVSNANSTSESLAPVTTDVPSAQSTSAPKSVELTADPVTNESNGKLICIDPGHSAGQSGAYVPIGPGSTEMKIGDTSGTRGVSTGRPEYELTMEISEKLKAELESRGYTVILTHYDNVNPIDCDARAAVANDNHADAFIRIHADGGDASARGALAICITPNNPWHPELYSSSRLLSDQILNTYCETTGIQNRGVLEEDNMTGNNWSAVPCVLLELGFMTNPEEDQLMSDPTFQPTIIKGIADGVDNYMAAAN